MLRGSPLGASALLAYSLLAVIFIAGGVQSQGQLGPGPYTEAQQAIQHCLDLTTTASECIEQCLICVGCCMET